MKVIGSTAILSLAAAASASWVQNINYRSPSEHHPGLGISLHKVNKRNTPEKQFTADQLQFTHGVASGDPYPDSVILWTRAAPMNESVDSNATVSGYVPLYNHGPKQVSTAPVCVEYKISKTKDFKHVECGGKAYTSSDIDYTVKVEAKRLTAFTTYYYQFNICDSKNASPIGRTKTAPHPNDYTAKVALAG